MLIETLQFSTNRTQDGFAFNQLRSLLHHHSGLLTWLYEIISLTEPSGVYLCNGSESEYQRLIELLVDKKTLIPLNPQKRPGSYLAWSDPSDVARVEDRTFVCTKTQDLAGPNNRWMDPFQMRSLLYQKFKGSMKGRTLYIIPFSMGPLNSSYSKLGIELTDSPYVVVNMKLMTRMGEEPLKKILNGDSFIKAIHSVGVPLQDSEFDQPWPCNQEKYIAHFPESGEIWSFGSGYGGNALLGKKCLSLRLGSYYARQEGWLAEHMLIMGVKPPQGEKKYIAAAFPSSCGKTNFAMLVPPESHKGWEITTVGDDIAWIYIDSKGQLRAINPEYGFFGVAPGTSYQTNPRAMETISKNTIFTNVALTEDGDVWWEGMTPEPPSKLTDWQRQPWSPGCGRLAAHPNARFTANILQCPSLDPHWDNPEGVPISAFIFGGRRKDTLPLVFQPTHWHQGVYFAATIGSETTAAATGTTGIVRRDPMAMLPFCGYNMADYFNHWLNIEKKIIKKPSFFIVNWFRKNAQGRFLWPGFRENIRVIEWILKQLNDSEKSEPHQDIFKTPTFKEINWKNLEYSLQQWNELTKINPQEWLKELQAHKEFFNLYGEKIPTEFFEVYERLKNYFKSQ